MAFTLIKKKKTVLAPAFFLLPTQSIYIISSLISLYWVEVSIQVQEQTQKRAAQGGFRTTAGKLHIRERVDGVEPKTFHGKECMIQQTL